MQHAVVSTNKAPLPPMIEGDRVRWGVLGVVQVSFGGNGGFSMILIKTLPVEMM
jgi:hypothetical protein